MRYTHELLGTNNVNGLSEPQLDWAILLPRLNRPPIAKFDPARSGAAKSSELLMSERFAELSELGE